jgi:hypothetical protein
VRAFIFDKYNTWYDWRLTLTAKSVAPPEPKTNYVALDGMSGTLDLSEALTAEIAYNDRTVRASFWTSEGTFMERIAQLGEINRALHGKKVRIVDPDDPDHYFLGRVRITEQTYDQVHAEFTIEAICDPWRYAANETERRVDPAGTEVNVVINNNGMKTLCPDITVTGSVTITFNGQPFALAGSVFTPYRVKLAEFKLRQGVTVVTVSGTGSVVFSYREAGL